MFFRLKQSPSGRVLQLLESYRNPEGRPRHRVVISLGDAALAQEDWKTVAAAVSAELYGQKPLLPPELSAKAQQWFDSITRRVMREGRWCGALTCSAGLQTSRCRNDSGRRLGVDGKILS